jgi:hypothetical protein
MTDAMTAMTAMTDVTTVATSDAEVPFYDKEGWKPMPEELISRVIQHFNSQRDGGIVYLPEFHCKKEGIDFEEANRSLSLKEIIEPKRKLTTRERLQAKLEERKSTPK